MLRAHLGTAETVD